LGGEATTLGSGGGIWLKTNHVTIIGPILSLSEEGFRLRLQTT
jgi:hypothetical protein